MEAQVKDIPKELIYEMVDGEPIYYQGYEAFLNANKPIEELMGTSFKQSDIITQLVILLGAKLSSDYKLLTNEIGIQFSSHSWRAADIAIIKKEKLKLQTNPDKYLEFAPEVVVEIDIKASVDQVSASSYFHKKTDQLLAFGVRRVVWIFTESQKVMVAEKNTPWKTFDWNISFKLVDEVEVNIKEIAGA